MAIYLYGLILRRNAERVPSDVIGLDDATVRTVACDDLCALVSTVASTPSRQNLEALAAHDRASWMVVRNAVTAAASRFGQTFTDERVLCGDLAMYRERLLATLERYDGYGEMRIIMRAVSEPRSVRAAVVSRNEPGRAYLESLRDSLNPRPAVDFRSILGDLFLDERVERRGDVQMIAHLVRFEDEARYRAAFYSHPATQRATITGPHALYSFAQPD